MEAMFDRIDALFLAAAFVSFAMSVSLWFLASEPHGMFVGLWVPSILTFWVGVRLRLLQVEQRAEARVERPNARGGSRV